MPCVRYEAFLRSASADRLVNDVFATRSIAARRSAVRFVKGCTVVSVRPLRKTPPYSLAAESVLTNCAAARVANGRVSGERLSNRIAVTVGVAGLLAGTESDVGNADGAAG